MGVFNIGNVTWYLSSKWYRDPDPDQNLKLKKSKYWVKIEDGWMNSLITYLVIFFSAISDRANLQKKFSWQTDISISSLHFFLK